MRQHFRPLAVLLCLLTLFTAKARAFDEDHKETINGTMLHFRLRGADKANPYLLILHGGPGFSAHMFYPWGPSLEKTVNVVYLDQRGCGESARLPVANPQDVQPAEVKGYTIATLLADIEGVRQSLHVSRWYVLGHSWGGMLGLEYVAAHPDHVNGFIDMDGLVSVPALESAMLDGAQAKFQAAAQHDPGGTSGPLLAEVRRLRALPSTDPMRLIGTFGLAMGPAGLYFAQDQATAFPAFNMKIAAAVKPYNVPYTSLMPAEAPTIGLILNDHFLTRDDTPLLSKIMVPTLIINGRQDGVITPQEAEVTHAGIKNSQLMLLDNCGHFPFAEQAEAAGAAIIRFVKAQPVNDSRSPKDDAPPVISSMMLPTTNNSPASPPSEIVATWTVDEQGQVQDIQFPSSGSKEVDAAIRASILSKRYTPPIRDGKPIRVKMTHTYEIP